MALVGGGGIPKPGEISLAHKGVLVLDDASNLILKNAMERLGLSARAFDRIIKVARTIADIDKQPDIRAEHMEEAIHYRSLDRDNWGKYR